MSKLMKLGGVMRPQKGKRSANSGRVAIYRREVRAPLQRFDYFISTTSQTHLQSEYNAAPSTFLDSYPSTS